MPIIELYPAGKTVQAPEGTPLRDVMFGAGGEFPCGGNGRCRGCRVKVMAGRLPVTSADHELLAEGELSEGWRLSCQAAVNGDLKLEVAPWGMPVLGDERSFQFKPRTGFGIAIDLGTTTVAAQLLDLENGTVLGVATALNAQAQHGADLMSRIEFALNGGRERMTQLVREQLGQMAAELAGKMAGAAEECDVVIVGNTAMHHFCAGLPVDSLAQHPFEPIDGSLQQFEARHLGWEIDGRVSILPCLGGFVGSDLLAGILATDLHRSSQPAALIDLGTNGEIIVGNEDRILCASTAAGPAFEGARISMGMRASRGAIAGVTANGHGWEFQVLGGGPARGICGSGLVDAVATALTKGVVRPDGRFANGNSLHLTGVVSLSQRDIRELQLAKGAVAAGLRILSAMWGVDCDDLERVHLAGAFGNYINQASARRIGLLPVLQDRIVAAGNTALLGARMALFNSDLSYADLLKKVERVALNEHPGFQDLFAEQMLFPRAD